MQSLALFWGLSTSQTSSYLWQKLLVTNYFVEEVLEATVFLTNTYSSFLPLSRILISFM